MRTKKALPKDSDLAGVDKALRRAAKKAREIAIKTRTPLYVFENGKVVNLTKQKLKTG
jgi:hypothetical protein